MVYNRLVVAEIVPNIIDVFTPQLSLSVFWDDAQAELGNTISPSKMREPPFVNLSAPSSLHLRSKDHPPPQLTLVLTDPDAPSHSNPKWTQVCHWIATQANTSSASLDLVDVMPWKAPGPPPKTGKHRYIFVVLAPVNGTSERLHLRKPAERFHWGWEKGEKKNGVRDWAIEMGLGVVGECPFPLPFPAKMLTILKVRISSMRRTKSNEFRSRFFS